MADSDPKLETATTTFDKNTFIYGMFFFGGDDLMFDVMGTIFKGEDKIVMEYRFRHYDPTDPHADPWAGKDIKSHYKGTLQIKPGYTDKETVEEAIGGMRWVFGEMTRKLYGSTPTKFEWVPVYGGIQAMVDQLKTKPWAHVKEGAEAKAELENYGKKHN